MKHINKNLLILAVGLSFGIFSCTTPQYTSNFTNDPFYKGDKTSVAKTDVVELDKVSPVITPEEPSTEAIESANQEQVMASKKNMIAKLAEIPSIKKIVTEHKENVENLKSSDMDQLTLEKEIRKEEKRAHKEVKKQLLKEIKEVKKAEDKEAMNKKVYIGIIIAAAGIVIAILASGGLGAVAIIVGVGLIAWGLIEQGSV